MPHPCVGGGWCRAEVSEGHRRGRRKEGAAKTDGVELFQTCRKGKKNKYMGQGSVFDECKSKEKFDELLMFVLVLLLCDGKHSGWSL